MFLIYNLIRRLSTPIFDRDVRITVSDSIDNWQLIDTGTDLDID